MSSLVETQKAELYLINLEINSFQTDFLLKIKQRKLPNCNLYWIRNEKNSPQQEDDSFPTSADFEVDQISIRKDNSERKFSNSLL